MVNLLDRDQHALLALALIVLVLFLPAFLQGGFPTGYDIVRHRSYLYTVAYQTFQQHGELPLWDPYTLAGFPYVANPHEQLFFPLNALVLLIPPDYLFLLFLLLFTFLAGVCMYALARHWLSPFHALIAALPYMLSGMLMAKIYNGVLSYFGILCLLPLLFLAAQFVYEKPTLRHMLGFSAVLALLITLNNMQLLLYGSTAAGVFLLAQLASTRWRNAPRILLTLLAACVLAALLSAVVLLPLFEGTAYSTISRETDVTFQSEGSLPPLVLTQFLMPWAFGRMERGAYYGLRPWGVFYNYVGILTLLLAVFALFHARNSITKALLWMGGFSLLFSFGSYTPFASLFTLLPGFAMFRFPSKMIAGLVLACTLLAGFGAAALFTRKFSPQHQRCWRYALWTCFAIALFVTIGIIVAESAIIARGGTMLSARYAEIPRAQPLEAYLPLVETIYGQIRTSAIILTALLGLSAALLTAQLRRSRPYLRIALALLLLADLLFFSMPLIEAAPRSTLFQNPIAEFLAERQRTEGMFRVLDTARALPQDTAVRYSIQMLDGYHTSHLSHYTDLTDAIGNFTPAIVNRPQVIGLDLDRVANQNVLDMLNVRYVLTPKPTSNADYRLVLKRQMHIRDLNRDGTVYVYENLRVLPRAFVVPEQIEVPTELLAALSTTDLRRTVLLDYPAAGHNGIGEMIAAEIVSYTPNRVTLSAQRDSPGYLVLGDMWYPGWRAFDNGEEVPVLRANGGIRAVPLNAGSHTVTFEFSPRAYTIGKWISLSALLLFALLWFAFPTAPIAPKRSRR